MTVWFPEIFSLFFPLEGNSTEILTHELHAYGEFWLTLDSDDTSIVFQVAACEEARIALAEIVGVPTVNTYEFVIGAEGNKVSHAIYTQEMQRGHSLSCGS